MDWLVLADDLTGACDTGAAFARPGRTVKVLLDLTGGLPTADVLVINTESRVQDDAAAAAAVQSSIWKVLRAREYSEPAVGLSKPWRVYQKIDSTLRGHPGEDLKAALAVLGETHALVAPAFPAQGRAVLNGRVMVNGTPLKQTEFGKEIREDDLRAVFTSSHSCLLGLTELRQEEQKVADALAQLDSDLLISDAETEEDLDILARAFLRSGLRVACGSAGLARALVRAEYEGPSTVLSPGVKGPLLAVFGTRHPASLRQLDRAGQAGVRVFSPGLEELFNLGGQVGFLTRVIENLRAGNSVAICAARLPAAPGKERSIAQALAGLADRALDQARVGALVLSGGDTAAALCSQVACPALDLRGEVLPGISWGQMAGGKFPGLTVVTKAGGFGTDDALVKIEAYCR